METVYCKDEESFTKAADKWLEASAKAFSAKSIYLPAGNTPKSLYEYWTLKSPEYLKALTLYQIDEVISERTPHLFEDFFKQYLSLPGTSVIPPRESQGVQADLAILGLGKNGHLAFHEPGIAKDFFFGEVELENLTKQTLQLERSARGITYGLGAFIKTKAILLLVKGENKQRVYENFLRGETEATVNGLRAHPNLTVVAMESFRPKQNGESSLGC